MHLLFKLHTHVNVGVYYQNILFLSFYVLYISAHPTSPSLLFITPPYPSHFSFPLLPPPPPPTHTQMQCLGDPHGNPPDPQLFFDDFKAMINGRYNHPSIVQVHMPT